MTTLGNFLDVPSFVLTSSVLVAGLLVGGRDIRRGLLASRDCLVPMGVIGMLIGAVKMLQSLSGDPSTLLVASGVALLPLVYALMLAPILGALAEFFQTESTTPAVDTSCASPWPLPFCSWWVWQHCFLGMAV